MKTEIATVTDYIKSIPKQREEAINELQKTILNNIPKGFEETLLYGMVAYVVPKTRYPDGYHCSPEKPLPFVSFASQKNFIALYHMGVYANPKIHDWFVSEYTKHCKYKIDMGKSCIRFKKTEDIPYKLIGELMKKYTVEEWISTYEEKFKK